MRRLWMVVALAGCASKAPVTDSFDDLAGLDSKSDAFSYRMKIAGALADDQSMDVTYTKTPRFRAVTVTGNHGDPVEIWVRSTDGGDAVTWLLDSHFKIVAKNDDADDTTLDSHVQARLPGTGIGTFYIVFRDYDTHKHTFTVSYDDTAQKTVPNNAPDSGNGPLVQAFLPLYTAAAGNYAGDSHAVPESWLPLPAQTGYADFVGASNNATNVTAWRFTAGSATAYAVISAFDSNFWVSLYDTSGTWIAHGHVPDTSMDSTIHWDLDIDDPMICRCGLAPDNSGAAGCSWVDGNRYVSDISDCD